MLHLSFCHTLPAITELHGRHANKPTGSWLPHATMPPHAGRALTCSAASAMRQSQANMHAPITSVEPMEANSWGT